MFASLTFESKSFIVGVRRFQPPHPWALPLKQFQNCRCDEPGDCARQDVARYDFNPLGLRRRFLPAALFLAHVVHPLSDYSISLELEINKRQNH